MHNYNKIFLEKLTILIFSYNRHKYLKRTIKYWSNYNIKLLVIENNFNESEIEEYLKSKGWIKNKRIEVNDFYIKN